MANNPLEQEALLADLKTMSDNQLIDRAAHYNACLRKGRELVKQGNEIVKDAIDLYTICKNELSARLDAKIERETGKRE
jgi:hypothetical protein